MNPMSPSHTAYLQRTRHRTHRTRPIATVAPRWPAFAFLGFLVALLAGCGAPPKPPTVDEALKRPANSPASVELQVCRSELQNTRILAGEATRQADLAAAALADRAARERILSAAHMAVATCNAASAGQSSADTPAPGTAQSPTANSIFTVSFMAGSHAVVVPVDIAKALYVEAKTAPLLVLRAFGPNRSAGAKEPAYGMRTARERLVAMRDDLVSAGVERSRIRLSAPDLQPAWPHGADQRPWKPAIPVQDGFVEIEVYRAMPVARVSAADPRR